MNTRHQWIDQSLLGGEKTPPVFLRPLSLSCFHRRPTSLLEAETGGLLLPPIQVDTVGLVK